MTNRELLKEAIADAKAVKEVAITNAKAALEEAFTPHLKSMFEKKMMDMEEEEEVKTEALDTTDAEIEELLKELEEGEDLINDPKTSHYAHGNIAEEEEEKEEEGSEEEGEKEEEDEVEIDLEEMSEEDLKKFIEEVVDEMIEAGELEAGHEGMEDEEGAMMSPEETPEEASAEEEIAEGTEEEEPMKEAKRDHKEDEEKTKKMKAMESELAEAIETINTLKSELNEINLLNSKLLYTNKIFKAKNLTESQKVKVLTAFDKAETVKEVKLVFETLQEGLERVAKKELVRESKGFASKSIGTSPKQPVVEVNPVFERMKKLAGL
jgi:hypothetical protein